jgi:predicted PurR-regulated permease PerM
MNISTRTIFKVLGSTALFVGLLMVAYMVRIQLVWIGTAFFLTVALNPLVEKFRIVLKSRALAVAGVFLVGISLLTFLLVALVPPLVHQTEQLAQNTPRYTDELVNGPSFVSEQIRTYHLVDRVKDSQSDILKYVTNASGSFFSIVTQLFASAAAGVTILVLTIFMLLESPRW